MAGKQSTTDTTASPSASSKSKRATKPNPRFLAEPTPTQPQDSGVSGQSHTQQRQADEVPSPQLFPSSGQLPSSVTEGIQHQIPSGGPPTDGSTGIQDLLQRWNDSRKETQSLEEELARRGLPRSNPTLAGGATLATLPSNVSAAPVPSMAPIPATSFSSMSQPPILGHCSTIANPAGSQSQHLQNLPWQQGSSSMSSIGFQPNQGPTGGLSAGSSSSGMMIPTFPMANSLNQAGSSMTPFSSQPATQWQALQPNPHVPSQLILPGYPANPWPAQQQGPWSGMPSSVPGTPMHGPFPQHQPTLAQPVPSWPNGASSLAQQPIFSQPQPMPPAAMGFRHFALPSFPAQAQVPMPAPPGFSGPPLPYQGNAALTPVPVPALQTVLMGLASNPELYSEMRSNSLVPLPLVRWLEAFPHAYVELAFFLPVNAAKAAKVEFSHQSGGPTNAFQAQLMPDPQRDQMRYFSTFLPSLQLVPISSFQDWKIAMERYIECLRKIDRAVPQMFPVGMRRHMANVELVHKTTQGSSSPAEPFRGAPFWSYYDVQKRSELFNDPGSGNWPTLDNSLVAAITLAYSTGQTDSLIAAHSHTNSSSSLAAAPSSSSSGKRADSSSSASPHPPKKVNAGAQQQSDEHCFYFNGASGCRFSATTCRKSHRCMRCDSKDHGAATHT